jgi:predicted hotdog family 3-hydroxylacyl-ACP dehydratase
MTDEIMGAAAIESMIPHRLPMRLVEGIVTVDAHSIVTSSVVRDTWPTARDGCVRTLLLVELIAQSAGVLQGWHERPEQASVAGGLLVGVERAVIVQPTLPLGTNLLCTVRISHGAAGFQAYEGEVRDAASVLWLSATVQGFRPDGDAQPGGRA